MCVRHEIRHRMHGGEKTVAPIRKCGPHSVTDPRTQGGHRGFPCPRRVVYRGLKALVQTGVEWLEALLQPVLLGRCAYVTPDPSS